MLVSFVLLFEMTLGLLWLSQRKQLQSQLELEKSKYRQKESQFQELRENFVQVSESQKQWESRHRELQSDLEREQALVLRLNQELAKASGSVQERAKALEWDLQ